MATCFLAYSSSYDHLKEPFRRLLETVGFDGVEVFDGPSLQNVTDTVLTRIRRADSILVLYGPSSNTAEATETKAWPATEAIMARSLNKSIAFVLHRTTELPPAFMGHSAPARFDFWDSNSFVDNVHHVVRQLIALYCSVNGAVDASAIHYRQARCRLRFASTEVMRLEAYHEIVARGSCSVFRHHIDCGGDKTCALPPANTIPYELEQRTGPGVELSLRFGECNPHWIEYFVEVAPGLREGQQLGYWRSFDLPNPMALTRAALAARAVQPGFPQWLRPGTYGNTWDILYDIDSMTYAFQFPRKLRPRRYGVDVLHFITREADAAEASRAAQGLTFREDPLENDCVLELKVHRPKLNHSYLLWYEPGV